MPVGGGGSTGGATGGAIRAGRAFVEFFADDSRVGRALSGIKSKVQSVGAFLAKSGFGLAGLGAGLLAPIKPLLDAVGEGGKLANAADAFGLTADEASRLFGIMRSAGSDLRDATEGIVTLNQRISDALEGTGEEAKKLFEGLGRGPEQFTGNSADKFFQLIDALRAVPDPAKRVQLLLKAVGEDTGKNLIPLLSMTDEEVRRLGDAFAMTAEDLTAARDASKAYTLAVAGIGRVWQQVVAAVAPSVQEVARVVTTNIAPAAEWVKQNKEVVTGALALGAALVAGGAALVAFGVSLSAVATIAGTVVAAVKFLFTPGGLLIAGVAAAVVSVADFEGAWRRLAEVATSAWSGIVAAVQKGDLATAFKLASAAIRVIWFEMLASMAKAFAKFVEDNKDTIIALGGLLGAMKGGRLGARFGPKGALIGGLIGGGAAVFATDQLAKALANMANTPALDAAAAAARAEMEALMRQAVAPAPGMPDGAAADRQRFLEEMAKRSAPPDRIRGSFVTPFAERQFGFGESVEKQQLNVQKDIAKNVAELPEIKDAVVILGQSLRLR